MKKIALITILAGLVAGFTGCADMLAPHTTLAVGNMKWSNPKNMTAAKITFSTDTNGVTTANIENISTVMDPQVISVSAAGLSQIISTAVQAGGQAAAQAMASKAPVK